MFQVTQQEMVEYGPAFNLGPSSPKAHVLFILPLPPVRLGTDHVPPWRQAAAASPVHMCSQVGLTQGRETKYLTRSHLSLGALLVSKQQKKKKKKKTLLVEIKDEGGKENVNDVKEFYSIYYIYSRGRWKFSPMKLASFTKF